MSTTAYSSDHSNVSRNEPPAPFIRADVITTFSPEGSMIPLYFEYKDSYQIKHSIKVNTILSAKAERFANHSYTIYTCICIYQKQKLKCTLRYHIASHYWDLSIGNLGDS
jgi:hypothetical protein